MRPPIKQVRFACKNIFHSPPTSPRLASLSTFPLIKPEAQNYPSINSILQTPTPGPISSHGLLYPSPPKKAPIEITAPKVNKSGRRPHPLLELNSIKYDLADHPSTATCQNYPISYPTTHEAATEPPLPFVCLKSVYLTRPINIYASNGAYVSLFDVLATIYGYLRINLTQSDFDNLPSQSDQRRTVRAYENRYRRHRSNRAYEEEKLGGMKRVDLLLGHNQFLGISPSSRYVEDWYLEIA